MEMVGINIEDLSLPLRSTFQNVHVIFGSLQMIFKVTRGVIVKHVYIYFIRNMYLLMIWQEFDFE